MKLFPWIIVTVYRHVPSGGSNQLGGAMAPVAPPLATPMAGSDVYGFKGGLKITTHHSSITTNPT